MSLRRDPLADPEPMVRRVYGYVAYRIGSGPDADDVTSEVFVHALRYRKTYDPRRGEPAAWLIGIARRCIDDFLSARAAARRVSGEPADPADPADLADLAEDTVRRQTLMVGLARLTAFDRQLLALRFGGDLTARQIGELMEMRTNAVEVALHRALARLRSELGEREADGSAEAASAELG